ncbi:MAG: UDP-N-acetylglucosamine 4-epimerase [Psychroserpens sp.]|jgi:UDP-N-acetylglucosamine 4-epimerase
MNILIKLKHPVYQKGLFLNERTTLNMLVETLREKPAKFDSKISKVPIKHESNKSGDIPHLLAFIEKAEKLLGYSPKYSIEKELEEAVEWYLKNLKVAKLIKN